MIFFWWFISQIIHCMNSLCVIKEKAWEELCSFSWFLCLIVPLLSSVSRLVGWKSCLPDDDGNVGTMLSEPPKESENSVHRQQCEIITGKIILSSNNFFNVSKNLLVSFLKICLSYLSSTTSSINVIKTKDINSSRLFPTLFKAQCLKIT